MAANPASFRKFEEDEEEWQLFKEQLEEWFKSAGVADDKKVSILINCLSVKTYNLVRVFVYASGVGGKKKPVIN